jgi:hypothetical protein
MTDDDSTRPAVSEWDGGVSWIAHPDEDAERASHALETPAGVWVVDPVDADGLDELLADRGGVAGVVVVHDRHTRDAEAVAARHDVAVHVPAWMDLTREKLAVDPASVDAELPGTGVTVHRLIDTDEWEEALLVDESRGILVAMEALGTLPSFRDDGHDLGVHPALETAPDGLAGLRPERILVGHGESIHRDATAALEAVLDDEDGAS